MQYPRIMVVKMKIKYLIIALFFIMPMAYADCVDLNDNSTYNGSINKWTDARYEVTKSITLCPGIYNIDDGLVFPGLYKTLDCDGATLQGSGSGIGIFIGRGAGTPGTYSPTNVVRNCNIVNYNTGIAMTLANANTIENNNLTNNNVGISITGSANNIIRFNTIQSSRYKGVVLDMATSGYKSTKNDISKNLIEGSSQGGMEVRLFSHENTIFENYFINNEVYGLFVDYSENNTIYNNFFNNTVNAISTKPNIWNIAKVSGTNIIGGAFICGNYWSDYSGIDADNDSIGDTPKSIGTNMDNFPLVYPIPAAEKTEGEKLCDYLSNKMNKIDRDKEVNIPNLVPFSTEVFNFYTKDNEEVGYVDLYKKKVRSFGCNISNEPTYNVYIKDVATLQDIERSENAISALQQKLSSKDIIIKGVSILKKVKMGFAKIGLTIAKRFTKR